MNNEIKEKQTGRVKTYIIIILSVLLAASILVIILMGLGIITLNLKNNKNNNSGILETTTEVTSSIKNDNNEKILLKKEKVAIKNSNDTIDKYYYMYEDMEEIEYPGEEINCGIIEFYYNDIMLNSTNITNDGSCPSKTELINDIEKRTSYYDVVDFIEINDIKNSDSYILLVESYMGEHTISIYSKNDNKFIYNNHIPCFALEEPVNTEYYYENFYVKNDEIYYFERIDNDCGDIRGAKEYKITVSNKKVINEYIGDVDGTPCGQC